MIDGDSVTDGPMGLFVLWTSTTALFGSTDGAAPMPVGSALVGLYQTPIANLAGYGGRYAVSSGRSGFLQSKPVGCRPAP